MSSFRNHRRAIRAIAARGAIIALASLAMSVALGQSRADEPLYRQPPFDTIKLDEANRNAVLKVQPLPLPDRVVPAKPKPDDEIEFHLLDRPKKTYRVAWEHVAEVKLFERMLLDQAEQLVDAKKLDDAYPYYEFLARRYPKLPELRASYEKYLMAGAREAFKGQRREESLALLWELYARDPQYKGAQPAILSLAKTLIAADIKQKNYGAARQLADRVAVTLKEAAAEDAAAWNTELASAAVERLKSAKSEMEAGRYTLAVRHCRQALAADPMAPGGKELFDAVKRVHRIVIVGVTEELSLTPRANSDAWAVRRDAPLFARLLATPGAAEGKVTWQTPHVAVKAGDKGTVKLTLDMASLGKSALSSAEGAPAIDAYLLAARIADGADPASANYRPLWARPFRQIEALDREHVSLKPVPAGADAAQGLADVWIETTRAAGAPYRLASHADGESNWVSVAKAPDAGPQEIIEHVYPTRDAAAEALRRGEVDVVDRLDPRPAAELASAAQVAVTPYAGARLDLLVANMRRPAVQSLALRQAIAHGVDRARLVEDELSRGGASGQFVLANRLFGDGNAKTGAKTKTGADFAAALRYDPGVARLLSQMSAADANAQSGGAAEPLVLGYPKDELATAACHAIQRQLRRSGVELTLREVSDSVAALETSQVDWLYVPWRPWTKTQELTSWLVAAGQTDGANDRLASLLAAAGTPAPDDPRAAEDQLDGALRDQALVVPLWRVAESLAYRRDLEGIGQRPVTLFQNVGQWRLLEPEKTQ